MKRVELYNLEDVKFTVRLSKYIKTVALLPAADGNYKLIKDSILTNFLRGQNYQINKTREYIRELMPGCDIYYEIDNVPETKKIRSELASKRIVVNLDENNIGDIEDTNLYYPDDNIEVSPYDKEKIEQIETFYEFDILDEMPPFGELCELEKTKEFVDGKQVWKVSPKIIQNRYKFDYALDAYEKGIRTVVRLPKGEKGNEIIESLSLLGKLDKVKEFVVNKNINNNLYVVEKEKVKENNMKHY